MSNHPIFQVFLTYFFLNVFFLRTQQDFFHCSPGWVPPPGVGPTVLVPQRPWPWEGLGSWRPCPPWKLPPLVWGDPARCPWGKWWRWPRSPWPDPWSNWRETSKSGSPSWAEHGCASPMRTNQAANKANKFKYARKSLSLVYRYTSVAAKTPWDWEYLTMNEIELRTLICTMGYLCATTRNKSFGH